MAATSHGHAGATPPPPAPFVLATALSVGDRQGAGPPTYSGRPLATCVSAPVQASVCARYYEWADACYPGMGTGPALPTIYQTMSADAAACGTASASGGPFAADPEFVEALEQYMRNSPNGPLGLAGQPEALSDVGSDGTADGEGQGHGRCRAGGRQEAKGGKARGVMKRLMAKLLPRHHELQPSGPGLRPAVGVTGGRAAYAV